MVADLDGNFKNLRRLEERGPGNHLGKRVGTGRVHADLFDRDAVEVLFAALFLQGDAEVAKADRVQAVFRRRRDILVAHQDFGEEVHVRKLGRGGTAECLASGRLRNAEILCGLRVVHARKGSGTGIRARSARRNFDAEPEFRTQGRQRTRTHVKRYVHVDNPEAVPEVRFPDGYARILDGCILAERLAERDRLRIGYGHGGAYLAGNGNPIDAERHRVAVGVGCVFGIESVTFGIFALVVDTAGNGRVHDAVVQHEPGPRVLDHRGSSRSRHAE